MNEELLKELNKLSYKELLLSKSKLELEIKDCINDIADTEKAIDDLHRADYVTKAEFESDIRYDKSKIDNNKNYIKLIDEILNNIEVNSLNYEKNQNIELSDEDMVKVIDYYNYQKNELTYKISEIDDDINEKGSSDDFDDELEELYGERLYLDEKRDKYENLSNDLTNKFNKKHYNI